MDAEEIRTCHPSANYLPNIIILYTDFAYLYFYDPARVHLKDPSRAFKEAL